eukprot:TRINITY_DN7433_c0_g1_i4.p4 TRINITY_DN7433_c0_g1~~TRINITY_DN7433_c0_g1_i4.p4  ORF type:complete len:255 (-),score=53.61 TRINITY_DN7433_c0_g1_i4:766-1530(-)
MVLDASKPDYHKEILTRELEAVGIRLNRKPPDLTFKKKKTGGVMVNSTITLTHLDEKIVARVLQEYKIHNADVLIRDDCTVDDLIDVIEGNRRYIKCLYVYNKVDVCSMEEVDEIARRNYSIPISCYQKLNIQGLLEKIWDMMALVRVYTKKVGHKPDFADPIVLTEDRGGISMRSLCRSIHQSMLEEFSYSLVWGKSAKHMPQRVGLDHRLCDEDVVQVVKKKVRTGEENKPKGKISAGEKEREKKEKKPLKT